MPLFFFLCCITLFVPPYLGVSNDGSFDLLLQDVGLKRMNEHDADSYFSYYERVYRIEPWLYPSGESNPVIRTMAKIAIYLDTLFTRDDVFDMRFLALIYTILYILVLFPLARFALERVSYFTEGIVIVVAFVLIFGDATLLVRFASFYPEPLLLIAFLGIIDSLLLPTQMRPNFWMLSLMVVSTLLILLTNPYCAIGGFILTAVLIRLVQMRSDAPWKTACILLAAFMSIAGVYSLATLSQQQTLTRKYHAMTRGVLLQSTDPEKTLASFGIDPRYSVLTDTYADQNYPVVMVESGNLNEGFFDRYTYGDILLHYVMRPYDWVSMLDLGVKSAFVTRPSYSGNFEQSVGLPAMAKTPIFVLWANFKESSAPKTVGFLVVLAVVLIVTFRRKRRPRPTDAENRQAFLLTALIATIAFAVLEITTVFVFSGDAEFLREGFLMGVSFDLWILLFIAEILHRTHIIKVES